MQSIAHAGFARSARKPRSDDVAADDSWRVCHSSGFDWHARMAVVPDSLLRPAGLAGFRQFVRSWHPFRDADLVDHRLHRALDWAGGSTDADRSRAPRSPMRWNECSRNFSTLLRSKFYVDEFYELTVIRFNALVGARLATGSTAGSGTARCARVVISCLGLSWVDRVCRYYVVNSRLRRRLHRRRRGGQTDFAPAERAGAELSARDRRGAGGAGRCF